MKLTSLPTRITKHVEIVTIGDWRWFHSLKEETESFSRQMLGLLPCQVTAGSISFSSCSPSLLYRPAFRYCTVSILQVAAYRTWLIKCRHLLRYSTARWFHARRFSTLKMVVIYYSETSVYIRNTRRYILEDGNTELALWGPQILQQPCYCSGGSESEATYTALCSGGGVYESHDVDIPAALICVIPLSFISVGTPLHLQGWQ
jgi:hypothetical protein